METKLTKNKDWQYIDDYIFNAKLEEMEVSHEMLEEIVNYLYSPKNKSLIKGRAYTVFCLNNVKRVKDHYGTDSYKIEIGTNLNPGGKEYISKLNNLVSFLDEKGYETAEGDDEMNNSSCQAASL